MHDIKKFEEDIESIKSNLARRQFDLSVVDEVIRTNVARKQLIQEVESGRAEIKKTSKEIGKLKKEGQDASAIMQKVSNIKKELEEKNHELTEVLARQKYLLSTIPNLVDDSIPDGVDESGNVETCKWGDPRQFDFEPKDHVDLGEQLDMLDFERGAKLTGSRFVVYKKDLARLERALINYMLNEHGNNGYEEIIPPLIVNSDTMYGTGQLPKFAEDSFKLEGREWFLIPTAEVPITNLKRDELFKKDELPLKYVSYTPCFRSEAGSHGKDTRGLIRLHQFNKVELVNIVAPEESEKAHQQMVDRACAILQALELPYRQVLLCGGDIGFSAKKCVDLEVWLPAQNKYREISSLSNCGDFQARRASIRFRNEEGKPVFAHTLNGSGLAVGRTVVAILENYQEEDGTIRIPKVLRPYMGGQETICKK